MSLLQTFKDLTPTKAMLAWTAAGASVLTMVLGFTWGGWVTGGSAARMANDAAARAHTELAAQVCAANFAASPTALEQHEELLGLASFRQRAFVQEQLWARMPGETAVTREVADLCARKIAEIAPEALAMADDAILRPEATEVDPG